MLNLVNSHDASKFSDEEYNAYDTYFYGNNITPEEQENFNAAWLHHIHNNPHHWEYWVVAQEGGGQQVLEMPKQYAIEMLCDWWSFGFKSGNLYEIFDWYNSHKGILLHPDTRAYIESLLNAIHAILYTEDMSVAANLPQNNIDTTNDTGFELIDMPELPQEQAEDSMQPKELTPEEDMQINDYFTDELIEKTAEELLTGKQMLIGSAFGDYWLIQVNERGENISKNGAGMRINAAVKRRLEHEIEKRGGIVSDPLNPEDNN